MMLRPDLPIIAATLYPILEAGLPMKQQRAPRNQELVAEQVAQISPVNFKLYQSIVHISKFIFKISY